MVEEDSDPTTTFAGSKLSIYDHLYGYIEAFALFVFVNPTFTFKTLIYRFGRSSNCDRAGCRWLSRFNECVARVGNGNYDGGGWRPPQCRDIWRERRCLNAPGCAWTCTARWNYQNEDVESIVVEEPVSMMKEKSSNSATGKISIGLTSMVMMYMMMFWS